MNIGKNEDVLSPPWSPYGEKTRRSIKLVVKLKKSEREYVYRWVQTDEADDEIVCAEWLHLRLQ